MVTIAHLKSAPEHKVFVLQNPKKISALLEDTFPNEPVALFVADGELGVKATDNAPARVIEMGRFAVVRDSLDTIETPDHNLSITGLEVSHCKRNMHCALLTLYGHAAR